MEQEELLIDLGNGEIDIHIKLYKTLIKDCECVIQGFRYRFKYAHPKGAYIRMLLVGVAE